MNTIKILITFFLICFMALAQVTPSGAEEEYKVDYSTWEKYKSFYDDPRPYLAEDLSWKKVMPPEAYNKLKSDKKEMSKVWAEVVGFRAPDLVGKIAPEIKPGKYTYKDKEKYPFKELMHEDMYNRFNPGAPPHAGNFPEIEVVPTQQYYYPLPIALATKENMGKTKLDEKGYILDKTYVAGLPFPRPSGKFKAQQLMYNWEKRFYSGESYLLLQRGIGFTKDLNEDRNAKATMWFLRLHGRAWMEPYGWYDERAKKGGEAKAFSLLYLAPRDQYANVITNHMYVNRDHFDSFYVYVNVLRRIRKLSATDTQDAVGGMDIIYDDSETFSQKLSPNRYPYKYEVIAEREYLVPSPTVDGSYYMKKSDKSLHNQKFERRPMYVIKLTQLDPNYVYSQRIVYMDKETFTFQQIQNYDQKGRLYRTSVMTPGWNPDFGLLFTSGYFTRDHLDLHTTFFYHYAIPAIWIDRNHVSLRRLSGIK
jgi:hypothetical protein